MIGILHVPVAIPLIVGDAGNAASYRYDVVMREISGCSVDEVVRGERATVALRIVATARSLVDDGARAIAGDCGTLLRFQAEVAAAVDVPVLLSPLIAVPLVSALTGGRPVGVLAANSDNVGPTELAWAGIRAEHRVVVEGLQTRAAWRAAIVEESGRLDPDELEADVLHGALALRARVPDVGALVLDCADMPPYGASIQAATGLPVFDALGLADLLAGAVDRGAHVPSHG
ncbi:MAG TPA: aspartate/glutamate racemase family protein [Solirubrobacteraceae bacterium]|nr:aspartate/glutamate racemase family protein [Solirubrobacteraceae bacterium]